MPTAICDNGHTRYYSNPRGTRIADLPPCAVCGLPWHAAVYDYDTKKLVRRAGQGNPHKGRGMGKCPVCSKRRQLTLKRIWHSYERDVNTDKMVDVELPLPDGVQPCWYHRVEDVRDALKKLEKEKTA